MPPPIPRKNNMDNLRLILAAIVVISHCHDLSLNPSLEIVGRIFDATVAVRGFFVISGFLIFMSYENSKSIIDYAEKRIRRIYPAYFSVIIIWSIFGILLTSLPANRYFSEGLLNYIIKNLAFLNFLKPNLPGVFEANPVQAVDGALWTIKIEVSFYLVAPLIAWIIGKTRHKMPIIAAIYVASLLFGWYFASLSEQTGQHIYAEISKQLPGQMSYFISGAALYYYHPWAMKNFRYLVPSAAAVYAVAWSVDAEWLYPAPLAILVITAAFFKELPSVGRYGDFSYGLYIWHFPIIQTIVALGIFNWNPFAAVVLAYAIASIAAILSWHLIEKRWLRQSSHYLKANEDGDAGKISASPLMARHLR